jgi:hypothetical protein
MPKKEHIYLTDVEAETLCQTPLHLLEPAEKRALKEYWALTEHWEKLLKKRHLTESRGENTHKLICQPQLTLERWARKGQESEDDLKMPDGDGSQFIPNSYADRKRRPGYSYAGRKRRPYVVGHAHFLNASRV